MWGDVQEDSDKLVARHRQVMAMADVSVELRLWACWCVRQIWDLLKDSRSRTAIEVAERFCRGEASPKELRCAWNAAYAAYAEDVNILTAERAARLGAVAAVADIASNYVSTADAGFHSFCFNDSNKKEQSIELERLIRIRFNIRGTGL
jgi:hypothetical protein